MYSIKISIIIPIYNVAPYIEQCILSVLNQSYTNIEVLLVDDCGSDESMDICKQIIDSYNGKISFRLLKHDCNRGLSAARNTGILASSGDWIFFLDSDDTISLNCIELMTRQIEFDTDMVIGDVDVRGNKSDNDWNLLKLEPGRYCSSQFDFCRNLIEMQYYYPVWNKLIKRTFIYENSLFFHEGLIHEDYLWSFQVATKIKRMAVIKEKTYYYLRRQGSLDTNENRILHCEHYFHAANLQISSVLENPLLWNNQRMFSYIDDMRVNKYIEVLKYKDMDTLRKMYSWLRVEPQYSLLRLLKIRCFKAFLLALHILLPPQLGFWYYYWAMKTLYL